jgi:hypothetical protein
MPTAGDEIRFRLQLRADRARDRAWLTVPVNIASDAKLELVPNSVATRSVITPVAYRKLRTARLIGLDVFDLQSGRVTAVLRDVLIGGSPAPDLTLQVRDVPELLDSEGLYLVDGYLGLDYLFFGDFGSIEINTRTLRVALRVDR